eukprot:TRINITY_DN29749_c0_g1_i2.p1 TRINITY_DN29749_c0_g1~~TRINITY_DN29749_c0_g1_i2.p1  ORF type:complete len:121 (-),score=2.27 TRINITY_DN29749_c0_g1_i2:201-563(-)
MCIRDRHHSCLCLSDNVMERVLGATAPTPWLVCPQLIHNSKLTMVSLDFLFDLLSAPDCRSSLLGSGGERLDCTVPGLPGPGGEMEATHTLLELRQPHLPVSPRDLEEVGFRLRGVGVIR